MQVWYEDRLVGNLNITAHPGARHIEMRELRTDDLPSPFASPDETFESAFEPAIKVWAFKIEELRAGFELKNLRNSAADEAHMLNQVRRKYSIPDEVKPTVEFVERQFCTRYLWKWQGLRVDQAQHEFLFDRPEFEPV